MKSQLGALERAHLQYVSELQNGTLNARGVQKGPMGAVLVYHCVGVAVPKDDGVKTRDARIVQHYVLIWRTANRRRVTVKIDTMRSIGVDVV
jgi:hypothetical protein